MNLNNIKEGIKTNIEGMSKWKKFKTLLSIVVGIFLLVLILSSALISNSATYMVQHGTLTSFPEKTVEDAFGTAFGEGSWSEYEQYGTDMVEYNTMVNGRDVRILFIVNTDSKHFRINKLYMDGTDFTYDVEYFLDLIYNNPMYFQELNNNGSVSVY